MIYNFDALEFKPISVGKFVHKEMEITFNLLIFYVWRLQSTLLESPEAYII